MKSCYINILETSTVSLSAGAEDPSYPLYRLYDRDIGKLFKANAAGTLDIKIDQGASPIAIDRLLIPAGHNLFSAGADLQLMRSTDDITWYTDALALGFETGVSGWAAGNGAAIEQSSLYPYSGSKSMKVTSDNSSAYAQAASPGYNVIEGTVIKVRAWVYGVTSSKMSLQVYDVTHGSFTLIAETTTLGAHVELAGNYTVPSGCTQIKIYLRPNLGYAAASETYWDCVQFDSSDAWPLTSDGALITVLFAGVNARYWKFRVKTASVIPELTELFLSLTYEWERIPGRPQGPFEDVFNAESQTTASGLERFLVHGNPKRQRVYKVANAGTTQKTNILALNAAWQGAKPFWLEDHEGNWIYGRLRKPIELKEEGYNRYSFEFDFVEVLG